MLIEDMFIESFNNHATSVVDIKDIYIGRIESINPLLVAFNGLTLTYKDIYINTDLLEHKETFTELTGTIGDSVTTIVNGSVSFNSKLKVGDRVALREVNDGRYYVISKVKGGV